MHKQLLKFNGLSSGIVVAENKDVRIIVCILVFFTISLSSNVFADNVKTHPLEKAKECIDSHNPYEAIEILSKYKPASHELSLYHYLYAKTYNLLKKPHDTITHLRMAYIYSRNDNTKERLLLERAETYMKIGYYSEASLVFKIFLKTFPDSTYKERVYEELADTLYMLDLFNEAIEFYERAGDTYSALYGKANSLHAIGKIKEAHELYMILMKKDRKYLESSYKNLYTLGENFRLMGEYPVARIYFNLVKESPWKYRAYKSLGLIDSEEERFETAIKYFKLSLLSPEKKIVRQGLLGLAGIYIKKDRTEEAKSILQEIREKYPYGKDYDEALYLLSQIYKREGKLKDAIYMLKELAFRHLPDKRALDEFEALILETQNNNGKEFLSLWKSVGQRLLEPSRSQSLLKIAKALKPSGKDYLQLCTWLSKHGSDDVKTEATLLIADFFADLGDTKKAFRYLKGIKGGEDNKILHIKFKLYMIEKNYPDVIQTALRIKDIQQDEINSLISLAKSIKNNQKILKVIEKTLNKPYTSPSFYINLGDLYFEIGKKSESLKHYQTAFSLYQNGIKIDPDELSWVLYRLSILSHIDSSIDIPKDIKGASPLNRFSRLLWKEASIREKMERVF